MVIIVAVILAVFLVWLERFLFEKLWFKNLDISIDFLEEGLNVGDRGYVQEIVVNDKRMPLPVLEIKFKTSSNLVFGDMSNATVTDNYYRRDIFSLKERQKITRTMYFTAKKRGCYKISAFDVSSRDYFMAKSFYVSGKDETKLLVYPYKFDARDYLQYYQKNVGEQIVRKRLIEDPLMFRSIREYTYTDPMKSINWKSSAKHGHLMVNNYESTNTRKVCIILDLDSETHYDTDELREGAISIASSVADGFLNQAITVWVRGNARDDEDLECLNTEGLDFRGHIKNIDKVLATIDTSKKLNNIEDVISDCIEEIGSDASYILIASKRRDKLTELADYYNQEGISFNCIIPYSKREMKNLLQTDAGEEDLYYQQEFIYPWRIIC